MIELLSLFLLLAALFSLYVQIRNDKVCEFRIKIIESMYIELVKIPSSKYKAYIETIDKNNYEVEELVAMHDLLDNCYALYDYLMNECEKVSYDKMLYSFKKLTVDNFFSQEWCEIYKTYVR